MSVDLAVWEGPQPASDAEARAVFADLAVVGSSAVYDHRCAAARAHDSERCA